MKDPTYKLIENITETYLFQFPHCIYFNELKTHLKGKITPKGGTTTHMETTV